MITLHTDHPVALASPDHLHPWGTKNDNFRNAAFNEKLIRLMPDLSVLDLGCSGGGFVKDMVDAGVLAVGVEGSDYSLKARRAEWATIPGNLFTADVTKPFTLETDAPPGISGSLRKFFTVITLWEVIEHIARDDLDQLFANIKRHLAPGGLLIMSVCTGQDTSSGIPLHQTVEKPVWWYYRLRDAGFEDHPEITAYFGEDVVRGWPNAMLSFHVCMTRTGEVPGIREGVLP
jgi:SAM-dependent methyltransferase